MQRHWHCFCHVKATFKKKKKLLLCVCACVTELCFFPRISRNLSSAMLTLAGRQTWGLVEGTYHNRTWKNGAESLFAVQDEVVYHFGKMFGCLPCTSSFGPLSWFSCTSTFPFKSMSGFFTHTNEVNGWLLFSSHSQAPSSPQQNALMTYTRAVAEICLQHLIKSPTLQSDQFALQYSSVTEVSTCTHTRRTAAQQQRGRDAICSY